MAKVKLFWDPVGLTLDQLGTSRIERITDGDTPFVSIAVRMLSIDTPEVHYPGNQDPAAHDERLAELADWIRQGRAPVSEGLAAHLLPRLADGQAGTRQKRQGEAAKAEFQRLLDEKLARADGSKRPVFLRAADEHFDQYGRLLAYVAPYYSRAEREAMPYEARATFNLLLVDSGWAAPFPIYPSLPKYRDLVLLREAAERAQRERRGAWADPLVLTGYEFRMCYRLWQVTDRLVRGESLGARERRGWIERYCADMTTGALYAPEDYHRVAPCDRVFFWPRDVGEAVARLNLVPAD